MAEGSARFHEDPEALSIETKDRHRAIVSLMEELEAIDWYSQRAEATADRDLAGLLVHNRDEETEHAAMLLEWLRRNDAVMDIQLRRYLFTTSPILEIEEKSDGSTNETGTSKSLRLGGLSGKEGL